MSSFDFGFYSWSLIQDFVLKGFAFSIQLTLIAMIGILLIGLFPTPLFNMAGNAAREMLQR